VWGDHLGAGVGVVGDVAEAGDGTAGVLGRHKGASGPGVRGEGHYGGQFQGTSAQLSLVPGTTVGKPTTGQHSKGEIFMDRDGTLFVCVADGTPGTWRRVVTEPA
jgi:hypothetical protein